MRATYIPSPRLIKSGPHKSPRAPNQAYERRKMLVRYMAIVMWHEIWAI